MPPPDLVPRCNDLLQAGGQAPSSTVPGCSLTRLCCLACVCRAAHWSSSRPCGWSRPCRAPALWQPAARQSEALCCGQTAQWRSTQCRVTSSRCCRCRQATAGSRLQSGGWLATAWLLLASRRAVAAVPQQARSAARRRRMLMRQRAALAWRQSATSRWRWPAGPPAAKVGGVRLRPLAAAAAALAVAAAAAAAVLLMIRLRLLATMHAAACTLRCTAGPGCDDSVYSK